MANYVYHGSAKRFNCLLWNVETVSLAFAIFFGIWDVVNLIFFNLRWVSIFTAIDLIAWIGILLASVKQMTQLYLPALIVNMFYIVLQGVACLFLLATLFIGVGMQIKVCNSLNFYTGYDLPLLDESNDMLAWTLVWFFVVLLSGLFLVTVQFVVYRAYIMMEEENCRHNIPIAELQEGSKKPLILPNSEATQVTGTTIYA